MEHAFSRTELLIGEKGLKTLKQAKVAVFGIGGVGSYVAEGLARAGVGKLVLIDHDTIDITNINRQIHATYQTIGKSKVEVMKERILSINPEAQVETYPIFYLADTKEDIIEKTLDYVVDAVDTVSAKLAIIEKAKEKQIPVISCMGTGNKLDPSRFEIMDISKTSVCPLAKVMRKELKKRQIKQVKVLYSKEEPIKSNLLQEKDKIVPASISFVPSVAGLMIAGEVVKDILRENKINIR